VGEGDGSKLFQKDSNHPSDYAVSQPKRRKKNHSETSLLSKSQIPYIFEVTPWHSIFLTADNYSAVKSTSCLYFTKDHHQTIFRQFDLVHTFTYYSFTRHINTILHLSLRLPSL
jgi:hypothetical protein